MESTPRNPAFAAARTTPTAETIVYWTVTALFCLEMGFTACYMLLRLPEGAQALIRLGFPSYFRVELAWAKLVGVVVLLAPAPPRLKEWAYAGFAINLISALIAHLSMGDGPDAVSPSAITSVLWGLSYFFWRRREVTPEAVTRSAIEIVTSWS